MLNKKLIAGSVLAVVSASASAVPTFSYTAGSVSEQGSAQLASVTLPEVIVTSGAEYSDDDLIVIDYNVALASGYTPASNLSMYAACDDGAAVLGATNHGGVLTLGLLSTDAAAGSVTYRVTDVDFTGDFTGSCTASLNSSVGAELSLGTPSVDGAAARAAGSVTGTYHATLPSGTTDIDGGSIALAFSNGGVPETFTTAMVNFTNQFADAAGNTLLSGVVDVTAGNPRSTFTGPVSTSTAGITLTDTAGLTSPASITGITFTLNGDFSFLVDEDDTTAGIQNDAFSLDLDIDGTGDAIYEATSVTASSISWTVTETSGAVALNQIDDIAVDFDNVDNGDGTNAMTDGSYTYDVAISYNDGGTDGLGAGAAAGSVTLTTGGAAGTWTLNGSTTTISNYPLSDAVTQFVWVTNKGSQDGGIFATAFGGTGAQTMASCDLGVSSPASEIVRITDELNACLTAAGMTAGRGEIVITVNAAAADI
ncbi:hypothetical protein N9W75_00580, partial [Porticoccaceae bacterium]|nr:hypothetical protein [Porticoccaceae bacterium]